MQISHRVIKRINALRSKKYRQKYQQFIIEGKKAVNELLLAEKRSISALVLCEGNTPPIGDFDFPVYYADHTVFKKLSSQHNPEGYLLIVSQVPPVIDRDANFVLYLDAIRDPGNLGTILRATEWFGMRQVFCSTDTVDRYNEKVIQSSMASAVRISVHYDSWQNVSSLYHQHLVFKAGMDGIALQESSEYRDEPSILILGNESYGSEIPVEKAKSLHIPGAENSDTESLNVAMACSIFLAARFIF